MDIFAYRVFCMGEHFPQPFCSLIDALRALYSPNPGMMADEVGQIIAYCRDGSEFEIPRSLFVVSRPRYKSEEEALIHIEKRMEEKMSGKTRIPGCLEANMDDPVEKQLADAMSILDPELNRDKPLEVIAEDIKLWADGL